MVRQAPDSGLIGATVVINYDNQAKIGTFRDIVQSFPSHSPGHGTISNDCHRIGTISFKCFSFRYPLRPRQRGRGMGVFHHIMYRFRPRRISRQPLRRAQLGKIFASGEDLMDIGLMPGIENNGVGGGRKHAVECNR